MRRRARRVLRLLLLSLRRAEPETGTSTVEGSPEGQGRPGFPSLRELGTHLFQGKRALIALAVPPDRHRVGLHLAVADHEHVRDLPQLGLADLAPDRLGALVDLDPVVT